MLLNDLHKIISFSFNDIQLFFFEICVLYAIYRLILTYGLIAKVTKVSIEIM